MSGIRRAAFAPLLSAALATSALAQTASKIDVVELAPLHAIVLPMKGPYTQHPQAFAKLAAFLAQQGLAPTAAPFGRYFSDPSVGEDNLVWEVGFPVAADAKAEPPFELKQLPGTLAAVRRHTSGYETLGPAWAELVQWVISNGYEPAGPALQSFEGDFTAPVIVMQLPVRE